MVCLLRLLRRRLCLQKKMIPMWKRTLLAAAQRCKDLYASVFKSLLCHVPDHCKVTNGNSPATRPIEILLEELLSKSQGLLLVLQNKTLHSLTGMDVRRALNESARFA